MRMALAQSTLLRFRRTMIGDWILPRGSWLSIGLYQTRVLASRVRFSMPRYALAAVVLEQMSYAQAMRYKKVIMEVALTAKADDKGPFLGVLYDELIRLFSVHRFNACGRFPSLQETLG